ncbi:hypothetical protein LCGC14_3084230, partial [marine sediment metagenome]
MINRGYSKKPPAAREPRERKCLSCSKPFM